MSGWTWVIGARKWHYFADGSNRSLCGKWMLWSVPADLEDDNDESSDNCAACRRKVEKRRIE